MVKNEIDFAGRLISANDTSHNMPAIKIIAGGKMHFMSLIFHSDKNKVTKQESKKQANCLKLAVFIFRMFIIFVKL